MGRLILAERIEKGYKDYLMQPKASLGNPTEIYNEGWCIYEGRACVSPHPHRHYTLVEFAFHCGKNENLFNRFISSY